MSNPNPWGQSIPSGQQGGGQVTFFDPSKFQKTAQDFPNVTATQQGHKQETGSQNTENVSNVPQDSTANAWSSWTWGNGSNPYINPQNSGEYTNNSVGYTNQNQWNGQQWNQEQQQQQSDQNQYHWDQNTQQWLPNYYDYSQQGVDPNQYGSNQYWNPGVSLNNNTNTDNYSVTNTVSDMNSVHQNNAFEVSQNSQFAQQESIGGTSISSSNDRNEPVNFSNHASGNTQQGENLNHSGSSYSQTQHDYLNQSATSEADESIDHSEGSVGRFFVNDYVGEGETHSSSRQISVQGVSDSNQQAVQSYDGLGVENTNVRSDINHEVNNIHNQTLGVEPAQPSPGHIVALNDDHLSQTRDNQGYTGHSDQGYQYYTGDAAQGPHSQVAKEVEKEEEVSHPAKSETHSEDGWEFVQPHGLEPPSHSRNHSMDNNVQFFISSGNSSLRVSPSGSSKSKDEVESFPGHTEGQADGAKTDNERLKEKLEKTNESHLRPVNIVNSEKHDTAPKRSTTTGLTGPPPATSVGPPPMGGAGGVNPFRKSPAKLDAVSSKTDNLSPLTQDSLLSSTRLDTTKTSFENSPVVLNQSISPIPPSLETQTRTNNLERESPDIQESAQPDHNLDTPVSSSSQRKAVNVPQSPIMPRKESPFQPPVPASRNIQDSRNKPLKASHNIPGVAAPSVPQNSNTYNRNNHETERAGRKTPEWDNNQREKTQGRRTPDWDRNNEYGRKTPDLDNSRRGYERRTGRRTPDWDRERASDKNRGRRTPDWDSRQYAVRYGRRTPDWDRQRANERDQGRRSPDWDSKQGSSRVGRKTPEWDPSAGGREFDEDKLSMKPPAGSSGASNRGLAQRTQARQSAFRDMVKNRSKNNVSPATSLLDFEPPAMSNILLVPATADTKTVKSDKLKDTSEELSDLKPVASLISSLSEQINTDDTVSKVKDQTKDRTDERSEKLKSDNSRESKIRAGYDRNSKDTLRQNRSYEKGLNDSRNVSRDKLRSYGSRDSLESELRDDSRERHRRGNSRDRDRLDTYDRYYRDRDRERPPSRNDDYRRNGYRDREYGRPRERYERPRSRQDENRPPSRQGEMDRSRSRADYDKDAYYRDKQRGYDYDDYYRRSGQYYDRSYYDYYYNYSQGYYDEMGYYHDPNASRYAYDQYQRRPRAGTPGSLSDAGDEFEYPPDLQQYSGYYDDHYGYYADYNGQRWDPHVQAWVQQNAVEQEPRRATPEKFSMPHMRASFGPNGQLVKILPNRPSDGQPATIEIHEVEAMLTENIESQEIREFPGPLVRGDTHKNDVLLFCQRKAKECTDDMELDDRESSELIWRFLELLIKQNGTIVGTDLADLLLEGHEPTTMDYRQTGMKIAQSLENLDPDEDGEVDQSSVSADRSSVNRTKTVEEVTDRFRHLLLYGRKKDALNWAMKKNLWGHALFLASKMDPRAHANVMTRFANVAMRMNDPLQTLYQQMSGRQPAAVTCVAEERWGDWRPHLAMILSNTTSRPDLDRKSITQLGDTLAAKGFLHASHFCYLMSQASFGSYNKKTSKIVLIGSSHSNLPLELFANNEAIQCTEIYEYALALGNTAVCLHNFQTFKFLYATRLSDWGFPQEALQYCEVIARNININPAFYQHTLVKLVYDLASQLKFSDPQRLEETDEMLDPDWLRGLHTTLVQFEEGAIQTMSGSATPMYFSGTRASSESGEVGMYMQQAGDFGSQGSFQQENGYGSQGQMYSIQEQSAYRHGYVQGGQGDFHDHGVQEQSHYQQEVAADHSHYQNQDTTDGSQVQQIAGNQWQQYAGGEGQENQANWQQGYSSYDQHQWAGQHQQQTANQSVATDTANQTADLTGSASQNQAFQHQLQNQSTDPHTTASWNTSHNKQSGFPPNTNLGNSIGSMSSAKRESLASTSSFSRGDSMGPDDDDDDEENDGMGSGHQPGIFDLQPSGPQKIIAPRLRKRTISGDSVGSGGAPSKSNSVQQHKMEDAKTAQDKNKSQSKGGEGIWGKIGGLFTRKGKNEMILPDDKEPSIVWDEDKKQWVNKDGTSEENSIAAPPPKDHELTGRAGPKPGTFTEKRNSFPAAPPGPTTDGTGNVFQRRKGPLGARGQYVDVLNPKPATTSQVPSSLFNTLPHAQSAPAIFVPGGSADESSKKHSPAPEPIQEEKSSAPPMSAPQPNALSALQDDNKEAPAPAGPSSAAPVLFNPSQFQGNQPAKQPQGGAGHRLSSRRVYPK